MRSSGFLAASLGFSVICHLQTVTVFTFFQFGLLFLFFLLIAMARTSKTMLNNNDKNGHPCLVSGLRVNAFRFSQFRMILAVGLSCVCAKLLQSCLTLQCYGL